MRNNNIILNSMSDEIINSIAIDCHIPVEILTADIGADYIRERLIRIGF